MKLKECIKNQICLISMTPNYPLGNFVKWVEEANINLVLLVFLLDEIQQELEAADRANRHSSHITPYQIIKSYWCLCCAQVRAITKPLFAILKAKSS